MEIEEIEDEENIIYRIKERYIAFCEKNKIPKALPILVAIILILALAYILFFSANPQPKPKEFSLIVYFRDEKGAPVSGLDVNVTINGEKTRRKTDSKGKISITVDENSNVKISLRETLYLDGEWTFKISEDTERTITLKLREKPLEKIIVRFETSKGSTKGKYVKVTLSCSNKAINQWDEFDSDKDGIIEITLPLDCGEVKVENAELENHLFERTFKKGKDIFVTFKEIEIPKGTLRVKIVDDKKELILNKNITVSIERDGERKSSFTQGYGIVEFSNLMPGSYNVYAVDPEQSYSASNTNAIVKANETTEVFLALSRNISAMLLIRTIDMKTLGAIEGATAKVIKNGNTMVEEITKENGIARVPLFDMGSYVIVVKRDGYFPKKIDFNVTSASESVTIELERITEENMGRTFVKVVDEEGMAVKDAKVIFKYKETGAIVELQSKQNYALTDENGTAEFVLGAINSDVYPFAIKYPAFGGSPAQAKKIIPDENNYFEVILKVGKSKIKVMAKDSEGKPLNEAYFEVFSSFDHNSVTKGKMLIIDGMTEYEIKAAQSVYVVVSKEGYIKYKSRILQLWPNEEYEINAVLLKEGEVAKPKIEFLGIFDGNLVASALKAGRTYVVKFNAYFPKGSSKNGFHFRIGENQDANLEPAFIKFVNAKGAKVKIGLTYRPPKSESIEELAPTGGKWASIEWDSNETGTYELYFEIKIKENVKPRTVILFYYRSYAIFDKAVTREPFDEELGELLSTQSKDGLYAKAHKLQFYEGSESACKELFCISGYWLYDAQEDIFLKEPYSVMLFGDYNFLFDIINNSQNDYNKIILIVKNTINNRQDNALAFESLVISIPAGQKELKPKDNEFKEEVMPFSYSEQLKGNVKFKGRIEITTNIAVEIVADRYVVFSKSIPVKVYSAGKLDVNIQPNAFLPFASHDLKIMVRDQSKSPIKGALVTVRRTHDDGTDETLQEITDNNGLVSFKIKESFPKTKIEVLVEKMGYAPFRWEKSVDGNIAKITPESISVNLNTDSKTQEKIILSIENRVGSDLLVKSARFTGGFNGILDEASMNANATTIVGKTIKTKDQLDFALNFLLSQNAEDLMQSNVDLNGAIEIIVSVPRFGADYALVVPFKAKVSLGGLPENAPCISLSGPNVPDWSVATINDTARTEVKISNICISNGKPIDLENLQAKLTWASGSKKAGSIEISINSPDGSTVTKILKPGIWTKLFDGFKNELNSGTYNAVITFKPLPDYAGETASFTIEIDGQTKTDKGLAFVGSDSKIEAKILIIDLKGCIKYPKEKITIKPNEKEAKIKIDANGCNTNISVWLCKDDPKCRGGTEEGGITLIPYEELKFTKTETSKSVTVYREQIAGQYGITVHAKAPDMDYQQIGTIDVVVEPTEREYFSMSRYEFTLTNSTNWKDSTDLINKMWVEDVNITAKLCTACQNPKKLPDYCIMNRALEKSTLDKPDWWVNVAISLGVGLTAGAGCAIAAAEAKIVDPTALIIIAGACFLGSALATYFTISGAECDVQMATYPFMDYVVNLPDDLKGLKVMGKPYDVNLGSDERSSYKKREQILPISFENKGKDSSDKSGYGILEIKAIEHIHGDPTHTNPKMERNKADFGLFNVPDTETKEYSQKIHLRFITNANFSEKLTKAGAETKSCSIGTKSGFTGDGLVPKIKLDWSWKTIEWNFCDADNENAAYCDAVQHSIALTKRLKMLDDFFKANNYSFECPAHPKNKATQSIIDSTNEKESSRSVSIGKVGVSKVEYSANNISLSVVLRAMVENKTADEQSTKIKFLLKNQALAKECEKETIVGSNSSVTVECLFENLVANDDPYFGSAAAVDSSKGNADKKAVTVAFVLQSKNSDCWLPYSTRKIEGKPALLYFIDRNIRNWGNYVNVKEINWPAGWPGSNAQEKIAFLEKLIEFDTLLVRDAYPNSLKSDFVEHYTKETFMDVPTWFSGSSGFKEYFLDKDAIEFETGDSTKKLPGPGKYRIFLEINFNNNFAFFREGKTNAKVRVKYSKISSPEPDSLFYYWPIDGEVGLKTGRNGYGSTYENINKPIIIGSYGGRELKTDSKSSNALVKVSTNIVDKFEYVNTDPKTRGNLLSAKISENGLSINFSPNTASFVIMKVSNNEENPIYAKYQLFSGGAKINCGDTLAYWAGIGNCTSFSGEPIKEIKNQPDEHFGESTYGLQWPNNGKASSVYLSTILFVPSNKEFELRSASRNVIFLDKELSQNASYNLKSTHSHAVRSIDELLNMMKQGLLCVSAESNEMQIWWNPESTDYSTAAEILSKRGCS
ncbi:MAG: carboxypeptidase-like regulatory domain-containing protein [Candidatus Diapherotrites archaeon]|nr:carboxypeptidase-like regulatory domain-containing protein [Candidatus Diapherotrites archaeon]